MSKRTKIPRASIQVGILDDEDYIALTQDEEGLAAFGFFVAVIVLARDMELNPVPIFAIKRRLGLTDSEIKTYSNRIQNACDFNGNENWLYYSENELIDIRSYDQWNIKELRGGARKGAGRKSKSNQSLIKSDSNTGNSVSVTVTDSVTESKELKKQDSPLTRPPLFSDFVITVIEYYSSICVTLPQVRNVENTEIGRKIAKDIKDRTKGNNLVLADWHELFTYVHRSKFLTGGNPRGWKASLDWIVNKANFGKVYGERYDNKQAQTVDDFVVRSNEFIEGLQLND